MLELARRSRTVSSVFDGPGGASPALCIMIHWLPANIPPAFVIGAHYDTFLQRALSRFFERATLETEAGAIAIVRRPARDRVHGGSGGAGGALVRQPLRAARAVAAAVHRARSALRAGDRQRARVALPRDPDPAADGGSRRALPRRDRGSLRRRVLRRHAVFAARGWRPLRARRRGARDAARRGAFELREPADLDRRAAARGRQRSEQRVSRAPSATGRTTRVR